MALIFSVYEPKDRVRATGWWAMMGAAAPAAGLIAGGPLVDLFGWRIVFVLQAVFSLVALALASRGAARDAAPCARVSTSPGG